MPLYTFNNLPQYRYGIQNLHPHKARALQQGDTQYGNAAPPNGHVLSMARGLTCYLDLGTKKRVPEYVAGHCAGY